MSGPSNSKNSIGIGSTCSTYPAIPANRAGRRGKGIQKSVQCLQDQLTVLGLEATPEGPTDHPPAHLLAMSSITISHAFLLPPP